MKLTPEQTGLLGTLGLLALYFLTMTLLTRSPQAAIEQFKNLWWIMLPLTAGFGIQLSLYTKLRQALQERAKRFVTASGATSAVGMLACCTHHLTDVLPLLGLSAVSIFLTQFQIPILIFSLLMNITGIVLIKRRLNSLAYVTKY